MKRLTCIILALAILLVLCACNNKQNTASDPVNFYYRTTSVIYGSDSSIITAEIRDAQGYSNDYTYLIEQYLNGPKTYDCISPFPAGTTMEEFSISGNKAQILLSPHLLVLSSSELMVACACLTKTIIGLTGVDIVQISAENGKLNNQEFITLTSDSFAYLDMG
jgi:hypothetical protein